MSSIQFVKTQPSGQESTSTVCFEPNLNLLAHAQLVELDIGSVCGGQGHCGNDLIRIETCHAKYFSQATELEKKHLGEKKLRDGWRLACQCYPSYPKFEACPDSARPLGSLEENFENLNPDELIRVGVLNG